MKSKIIAEEKNVLLNFLKFGLSTRQLDNHIGYNSKKTKGWQSWRILKKYKIESIDQNKLFCFRTQESLIIIKDIISAKNRNEVKNILNKAEPNFFEKYRSVYIVADSKDKVLTVLSGEVRNITQSFFSPLKKLIGSCQYPDCNGKNLDTVHLMKSRPEIFKLACDFGCINNSKKYDVYKILRQYIHLHTNKKSICFLCKKHHNELTKYEKVIGKKLNKFRNKILSGSS